MQVQVSITSDLILIISCSIVSPIFFYQQLATKRVLDFWVRVEAAGGVSGSTCISTGEFTIARPSWQVSKIETFRIRLGFRS